jgi:hypothetical protein
MKNIQLPSGAKAMVDDEDFDELSKCKWRSDRCGYARRHQTLEDGRRITQHMHRMIMGLQYGDKRYVDHIDGNRLNNQRSNLRLCSFAQNMMNKGISPKNTTGLKGVARTKSGKRWRSFIHISQKQVYLGTFDSREEAHAAYCRAAKELHGEFANTGEI